MQLTQKKYKAVNVQGHNNTAAKDILGGGAIQYQYVVQLVLTPSRNNKSSQCPS